MLSLLLGKYQRMLFIAHMLSVCFTYPEMDKLVSKVVLIFYRPTNDAYNGCSGLPGISHDSQKVGVLHYQ